jgi:hypothetical protein
MEQEMNARDKERLRRVFGNPSRSQESEVLVWLADGITLHTVNKAKHKGNGKANGRNGNRANKKRKFK